MQKITRIGVYGVVEANGKLLLVIQKKGPFKGKYDFPGGGIEFGETADEALRREFMEEVASDFDHATPLNNLTATVDVPKSEKQEAYCFYQIGMLYQITGLKPLESNEIEYLQNHWIDLKTLTEEQCSSLLWKFLQNFKSVLSNFPYRIIDLTHILEENIPSWDLCCGFIQNIKYDYSDSSEEVKFLVNQLKMDAGIGTHLDAPAHCFPHGTTIDQLPLENLILPCVVIDVSKSAHERYSVSVQDIKTFENTYGEINKGQFIMIRTGWEKFWDDPKKYHNNHLFPSISKEAAYFLLERGIAGIGIDTLSPDRPEDGYPVHEALLGAGKYIVENAANLHKLPRAGSFIMALPLKIKDGTESPIRLVGLIPQ